MSNFATEIGVSDTEIKLGMSSALSGPSAQLGIQLKAGAMAYFDKVNERGGINNRKINLISLDDRYEPQFTVINTRELILHHQVFALFSYVGTPTSHAILPLLRRHKTPYLMPFTGAEFLRKEEFAPIFNLRASYYEEAKVQIDYLIKEHNASKIAFLIQADEFGLAVENGLRQSLSQHQVKPITVARFKRNTQDINKALLQISDKKPDAVCLVGTYKPLSQFINQASESQFNPIYTSVSFASSYDLFRHIKQVNNLLVTEVVPEPRACTLKWCQHFKYDMKKAGVTNPNQVHLEGYLNAYVLSKAIKNCSSKLTRNCVMKELSIIKGNLVDYELPFNSKKMSSSRVFKNLYSKKAEQ